MRRTTAVPAALLTLLAAVAAQACTDGSAPSAPAPAPAPAGSSPPPPPPVTIALTAAPAALTLQQGQSGTATITLARGGHDAAVTLGAAVAGGAADVTATLAPATVPAGGTESVVTFATTAATPAGEHTVTLTGAGGGANATTTLVLRVTPAPARSYALAAPPSPVAVTAGGAAAVATVGLARTNFAGAVTLVASGAPAGLTVTAPSAPVVGESATLGVQAAATVPAGEYPVTLTGTSAGLAPVTASLVVRVAAAQGAPEPGVVSGVALDGAGRPIAGAKVQVKMLFNPNVVTVHTGADGRYTARGLPSALAHQIWAWHRAEYQGRSYCVRLAMPSASDYDAFVPSTALTRDFRWQLTGRVPDADGNYFGASLALVMRSADYEAGLLEDGDDVEVRLTPQGPLVDGSQGAVVTRTARFARAGWASRLDDIPHGVYTAQAWRVRGGVRTPLRVGNHYTGQLGATAAVAWEPKNSGGTCGAVLSADLQTFSLQLAPE